MAEPSGSPIIILSEDDDDDDDVVVIKMEKIPVEDDDDDVVFISQTPATTTTPNHVQLSSAGQSSTGKDVGMSSTSVCETSTKVCSLDFKRSDSISTVLGQTLRLNSLNHCPLDLSRNCGQQDQPKVKCEESAMELLSSVEAETSGMDYKEMDAGVGVTSTSDLCGAFLAHSDVVTDASLVNPAISPVIIPVTTLSPMSSDLQGSVQSPKSGPSMAGAPSIAGGQSIAGGSIDEIHSMPSCLDSSGNTSVDNKTKLIEFSQDTQDMQSASAIQNTRDLLINFNHDSTRLSVDNNSSTMSNSPADGDVRKGSTVSLNSSEPSSPSDIQKSANLLNSCDQSPVSHTKHITPVQSPGLDSMKNSNSTQLPTNTLLQIASNTASAGDPSKSTKSLVVNVNLSAGSASRIAQCNLPPRKRARVTLDEENDSVKIARPLKPVEICVLCKLTLIDLKVSRCTQGHPACGACLEGQVKLILTDKQGSLECIKDMCSSYYPMSELKHALPSLVVDILEDKLHKDYINFISDMMLTNVTPSSSADMYPSAITDYSNLNLVSSTSTTTQDHSTNTDQSLSEQTLSDNTMTELLDIANDFPIEESRPNKNNDLPPHWFPMDKKTNLLIIELQPESEEYVDIAIQFYETMTFPTRADVVKIYRVQNPILWKYYCLKKMEMIHENDCHEIDVRLLFHGTTTSVIESICRKGFDWRVCGKHGCVYGQGCYFASAASYSHQYTDKIKHGFRSRLTSLIMRTKNLLECKQASLSSNQPILPKPSPSLVGPFVPPPPAHMQFPSQNAPQASPLFISPNVNCGMQVYGHPFASSTASLNKSQNLNSQPVSTSNAFIPTSSFSPLNPISKVFVNNVPYSIAPNIQSYVRHSNNNGISLNVSQFPTTNTTPSTSVAHPSLSSPDNQKSETTASSNRIVSMSEIIASPTRKIFLASVLVGKYTGGNSSLRKPPPFFPFSEPYGKCYDSCVDDIFDPKIVVIFDSNQAYPEYIVEYNFSGDS